MIVESTSSLLENMIDRNAVNTSCLHARKAHRGQNFIGITDTVNNTVSGAAEVLQRRL